MRKLFEELDEEAKLKNFTLNQNILKQFYKHTDHIKKELEEKQFNSLQNKAEWSDNDVNHQIDILEKEFRDSIGNSNDLIRSFKQEYILVKRAYNNYVPSGKMIEAG